MAGKNSLGMIPRVLVYQNSTGVPNVTTATNVPKMTKNDPSVPVFGSEHFYIGF